MDHDADTRSLAGRAAFTGRGAERAYGIPYERVRKAIEDGDLPAWRAAGARRRLLILRRDLEEWIATSPEFEPAGPAAVAEREAALVAKRARLERMGSDVIERRLERVRLERAEGAEAAQ